MTTPTIKKMVKVYIESASIERLKCGRPNITTVQNTLSGVRHFLVWLNQRREKLGYERIGFDEDFPLVSIVKPALIHKYLADLLKSGVKPITAISYLNQFRQLFANWARNYYDDHNWKIPQFPSFGGRPKSNRYSRPSTEQLAKVKVWYNSLSNDFSITARRSSVQSFQVWFVATMMLEFAMRNSDIKRLTPSNFISKVDNEKIRHYLNYQPHKTANSSGRIVKWPIHEDIWNKMTKDSSTEVIIPEIDSEVFYALNRQMRTLGFTGSKGAYELRKICIDHVYQRFGIEMAVSISGDNIRTIMHYYADPAQPNIENIRITDLI